MVLSKGDLEVIHIPLLFKVFIKTSDGGWTLKASFATAGLAGAWVIGMASSGRECKIFEKRQDELFEVTPDAVQKAAEGMKADIERLRKENP